MKTDGDGERELMVAQNLYGLGKVAHGGAIGVADWFTLGGVNAIVTYELPSGAPRSRALLQADERSTWSSATPDGSVISYCLRDSGDCFLDRGDGRRPMPRRTAGEWTPTASGPRLLAQDGRRLFVMDADGVERASAVVDWQLRDVLPATDDTLRAIVVRREACWFAQIPAERLGDAQLTPMPDCVTDPNLMPDGRLVAVARASRPGDPLYDTEVVSWRPGDEAWTVLTVGEWDEELVAALGDDRVVFNRRLPPLRGAFDTEIYRRVVCTADVP
jgi:hypothetical protein